MSEGQTVIGREGEDRFPFAVFFFGFSALGLRISAGAAYQFDSGDADEARRVFINDNQGGTMQDYGFSIMVLLELTFRVMRKNELSLHLYGGLRGNFYQAHFAFIGNTRILRCATTLSA